MKICAACREPWPSECICDDDEPDAPQDDSEDAA